MQHQLVHAFDDVPHRHEHIALKLGVVAVSLCIPQQQRKLGNEVLQIVDYKRRHAVERVEFARFEQGVCYLNLTEVARCLPARSLQQVEYFEQTLERHSVDREREVDAELRKRLHQEIAHLPDEQTPTT